MDTTTTTAMTTSGLEGVVVADTRLSEVDGERGRLVVAGHDIERLVLIASFEDVVALLATGTLPDAAGREATRRALAAGRVAAIERLRGCGDALQLVDGMDSLRASTAHLSEAAGFAAAGPLIGAVAVHVAAWARVRAGGEPVAPDPTLSHAADYLRMLGVSPDAARVAGLDAYLATVADHGLNASTFAARVVISTGSDLVSAIVAAIGALKGPLHGGAPGPVLDMLDALGDSGTDGIEAWLGDELAAGRRIMGMGHRIYRVRDPRAAVLEEAVGELARAREVERAAERMLARRHPARALRANVEFYTAVLLEALGLGRQAFTPTFAVGRVAGWCAHVAEQRATGRLIRPASRYVGPMPARSAAG